MSEPVWGVLTRAADRLAEMASVASRGPWDAPDGEHERVTAEGGRYEVARFGDWDNAIWCAAMSPVVAAPLVEWLRQMAVNAKASPVDSEVYFADDWHDVVGPALRFARLVLGEPEGPPRCPTCGPTTLEPHPRRDGVERCSNCKEVFRG